MIFIVAKKNVIKHYRSNVENKIVFFIEAISLALIMNKLSKCSHVITHHYPIQFGTIVKMKLIDTFMTYRVQAKNLGWYWYCAKKLNFH